MSSKLDVAKRIISDNIEKAKFGLFDTRNILGDPMTTLYSKDGLTIDICFKHEYFEVFGLSEYEFSELFAFYQTISNFLKERED